MLEDRQLSQMFLRKGLIDESALDKAKELSADRGASLYEILLREEFVNEEKAIVAVSKQLNLPCVSLREFEANRKILDLVTREMATEYQLMPLGLTEEDGERKLYVAMANPLDIDAIEEVGKMTGFPVVQLLAGPNDIEDAIERCYANGAPPAEASQGDFGLDGMLDNLFDEEEDGEPAQASSSDGDATPAGGEDAGGGLGGFTLDFGDLGLSVGDDEGEEKKKKKKKGGEDVHNRMTLPAGTEIPSEAAGGFKRQPTTVKGPDEASLKASSTGESGLGGASESGLGGGDASDSGGGPLDDWSDLATFGLEEESSPGSSSPGSSSPGSSGAPATRTENSTVRYVADPSLQRPKNSFPHNVPSSDLIRATVELLVAKGILTEKQLKEAIKQLRHGSKRRR